MKNAADSYVIRIYRRDMRESRHVAGLVEIIEQERTETFKNAEELMRILGIDSSVDEYSKKKGRGT